VAFRSFLSTNTTEDKKEYRRKGAIAKCEVRKTHREGWENFVSQLENDIIRPEPQRYKIILKNVVR
jgi:hypothetical protein